MDKKSRSEIIMEQLFGCEYKQELPTTSDLFKKYFGDGVASVNLTHPNIEKFFSELNRVCLLEDKLKKRP